MGRALTSKRRRPEGPAGPEVITIPTLIGGAAHGAPADLPLQLKSLALTPSGVAQVYYGHAISYPPGEVVFEAAVAVEDQAEAGRLIWREIGDKLAKARWPAQD